MGLFCDQNESADLLPARKQEVDDGAAKGEEPNDEAPDNLLARVPILLDEAEEGEHGQQQIGNAGDAETAAAVTAATGSKQERTEQAQQNTRQQGASEAGDKIFHEAKGKGGVKI